MLRFADKTAELGGAGNSTTYEQAFANLAHGYIRDVAPGLLDYELGFQLIDRDDDAQRAFGALVAKIGENTVVVPAFQLRGKMKGHEMMYLADADKYVPLSEGWLNYLISRKPVRLGESLGTRNMFAQRGLTTPNMAELSRSPLKVASVRDAAHRMAQSYAFYSQAEHVKLAADEFASTLSDLSFPKMLALGTRKHADWLLDTMRTYPKFAEALLQHYSPAELAVAIKTASSRCEAAPPTRVLPAKQAADVKIQVITAHTYQLDRQPLAMQDSETLELQSTGRTITDRRSDSEVKTPIVLEGRTRLRTPERTGIYEVLVRPNDFVRALVIVGGCTGSRTSPFATVILLDTKEWVNAPVSGVWALESVGDKTSEQEYADLLSDASPISSISADGDSAYVILSPDGRTTAPFAVLSETGSGNRRVLWCSSSDEYAGGTVATSAAQREEQRQRAAAYSRSNGDDPTSMQVVLMEDDTDGAKMLPAGNQLYVPATCRVLRLPSGVWRGGSDNGPQLPSSYAEIEMRLASKMAQLSAWRNGTQYSFDCAGERHSGMDRFDATVSLMKTAGLRREHAEAVLSRVDSLRWVGQRFECHLKTAGTGVDMYPDDTANNVMNFQHGPVQGPVSQVTQIPGQSANDFPQQSPSDPFGADLAASRAALQQAAASGKKELFDLGAFEAMVRTSRPDNLFDAALPHYMSAMDATSRQLMQLYSHQQEFAERYGKRDIVELEDSLRSLLEQLGTVTLFLKRRSGPTPEPGSDMSLDLSVSDAV